MKKFVNFSFCAVFVLAACLLVTGCKAPSGGSSGGSSGGGSATTHDIVTFGSFPQSLKAADVNVDEAVSKTSGTYTYYKGSDDEWYAKVDSKYYKVEPIKWRVLTTNYDHDGNASTPGKKLLLAESILINCMYYDYDDVNRTICAATIYPNNYENSRIRAYLNGLSYQKKANDSATQVADSTLAGKGFLQTAFTQEEQNEIATTTVINNARSTKPDGDFDAFLWFRDVNQWASDTPTSDKILLLSLQEVTKAEYGFAAYNEYKGDGTHDDSTRIRMTTAFAKESGADQNTTEGYGGCWWLRSPSNDGADSFAALMVGEPGGGGVWIDCDGDGWENDGFQVDYAEAGVVPALCLN